MQILYSQKANLKTKFSCGFWKHTIKIHPGKSARRQEPWHTFKHTSTFLSPSLFVQIYNPVSTSKSFPWESWFYISVVLMGDNTKHGTWISYFTVFAYHAEEWQLYENTETCLEWFLSTLSNNFLPKNSSKRILVSLQSRSITFFISVLTN